jgi:hypothetical protein|tara:strand:+ start:485 stop:694 length:210 start_codon:yes stop_codon:yes gene_type:complete
MIKIFSNIFKVRFSFVSARVLFIFFLFFFVKHDLHAQSTYGVPICTFYSSANSPQGAFGIYVKQVLLRA